ncbi:tannase and feruloyl esterase [Xylariaceae sp. FL0016]|nr:tannase and feruloyl esterase [Xylariaceae sp. FL0016]
MLRLERLAVLHHALFIMVGVKAQFVATTALLSGALLPFARAAFEDTCAGLVDQLAIANTTIVSTVYYPNGGNVSYADTVDASCLDDSISWITVAADMCRVQLNVATSSRSGFMMEMFLPRNWTGRFLSTGNGGINGCIDYAKMGYATSLGFASTGTNNGHQGFNLTTALNNSDVVTDFSWRSLYTSSVVGKQITKDFYGASHNKSYYLGCSTGGRQGFQMAEQYPDAFDGIVAGSPAFNFDNLTSWSGAFHGKIAEAGTDGYPPESTWSALDDALLSQCDGLDGAVDGIIEDPMLCQFRPEALICASNTTNSSTCITGKQAETARSIFEPVYGVDGSFVYPRLQPGPGLLASTYSTYASAQFLYTDHWFKYVITQNPNLNTSIISPELMAQAWNMNPANINVWSGDLTAFADRGAKLLTYHGQQDPIISSEISNRYYDHASRTMNKPSAELDPFYRFFRISGMEHCSGGPGATFIGNEGDAVASLDPSENVLMAMVQWVEEGVAPETITGTAYVNQTKSLGEDFKRVHCRYPLRNRYTGTGDGKDTDGWECV